MLTEWRMGYFVIIKPFKKSGLREYGIMLLSVTGEILVE